MSDLAEQVISEEAVTMGADESPTASGRNAKGQWLPGTRGGPGRSKGPHFATQLVKALKESFEQLGGVDYLRDLATHDPRSYATLLGKMLGPEIKLLLLADAAKGERAVVEVRDYAAGTISFEEDDAAEIIEGEALVVEAEAGEREEHQAKELDAQIDPE